MAVNEEYRNYKRFPIQIGRTTYAIIHMFEYHPDHIEDIMLDDKLVHKMCNVDFEKSADQFIKQFEGDACVAFIKALRDKCNEYINEDAAYIHNVHKKYKKKLADETKD